jgi:thiol-disulfide isomerase/thioredoxin
MRKFSFAIVCIITLSFFSCTRKRPAVIEQPVFESWNSDVIQIEKIEMNDTATVMHVHAFYRPNNWIRIDKESYIRKSGSDEKWPITKSEGIELNKEFYMPQSGETTFKLIFPALPPDVTTIDFIESDCEACFKIWGIHLLPGSKITFMPLPSKSKTEESLPAPVYSAQPATVSGKLFGYVKGENPKTVSIYYTGLLNAEPLTTELPVAEDGSFSGEIAIGFPSIAGSSLGSLFLTPGKELKVFTDLKKKNRYESKLRTDKEPGDSVYQYFEGSPLTFAELRAIEKTEKAVTDYDRFFDYVKGMKPGEYKNYLLGILKEKTEKINQSNHPDNIKRLMKCNAKLEIMSLLLAYESFATKTQTTGKTGTDLAPEKPGTDYYSFLSEIITDEMSYSAHYAMFISIIRQEPLFSLSEGDSKSPEAKFAFFKEKIAPLLGTDAGIFFDIIKLQIYGQPIQEMKFYTDAEKQDIKKAFGHSPEYAQTLINESDRVKKMIEDSHNNPNVIINEAPNVAENKVFDAIIAKYKGKIVVVDFWATWCHPCMQAMELIKPLKKELQAKGVVFLYLTGETSPLDTWNKKIPDIHGEHYRVSGQQWSYFAKQFDIPGIPTYMIYNKNGKQIMKQVGFPGNEAIENAIKPLL